MKHLEGKIEWRWEGAFVVLSQLGFLGCMFPQLEVAYLNQCRVSSVLMSLIPLIGPHAAFWVEMAVSLYDETCP